MLFKNEVIISVECFFIFMTEQRPNDYVITIQISNSVKKVLFSEKNCILFEGTLLKKNYVD